MGEAGALLIIEILSIINELQNERQNM